MKRRKRIINIAAIILICTNVLNGSEIHDAVRRGDLGKIKLLIKNNPQLINEKDDEGDIPLCTSILNKHLEISRYFIENGADINNQNQDGYSPLHWAAVFSVVGDSIRPEFFINLGEYKLPQEYRAEVIQAHPRDWMKEFNRLNKGFWYASVFQAGNNLFITSGDYVDENQRNMIFQKDIEQGKLVIDSSGSPGEITNDIDGGLDFWPIGSVNDSTVFMPIPPYQLLAIDTNEKLTGGRVSDRVARAKFQTMLSELSENDNPVLMLVKLSEK